MNQQDSGNTTATVTQNNTLSTPVLVTFILAFVVLGIFSGWALGKSDQAVGAAQLSERNAKLAQYQTEEAIKKWEEERRHE